MSEHALAEPAYCPNCNAVTQFFAHRRSAYITVLSVRLIPVGRGPVQWVCSSCGFESRAEALDAVQFRRAQQLGIALRASLAYLLRRISPGNGILALAGELASGCFDVSPEYSVAHAGKDLDWFLQHGCLPYIQPAQGLLVGDEREDFFGLVAVLGLHLADTQPDASPHLADLALIGDTIGLSRANQHGLIMELRSIT